jgi:hypothetical protein
MSAKTIEPTFSLYPGNPDNRRVDARHDTHATSFCFFLSLRRSGVLLTPSHRVLPATCSIIQTSSSSILIAVIQRVSASLIEITRRPQLSKQVRRRVPMDRRRMEANDKHCTTRHEAQLRERKQRGLGRIEIQFGSMSRNGGHAQLRSLS